MAQVFISYRQESDDHCTRVREFAERLQGAGLDVILDAFYKDQCPGGPDDGWDSWSAQQAEQAEKIIVIGSSGWFDCAEGKTAAIEPLKGLGAALEARIIYTQIYKAHSTTSRHRLVIFEASQPVTIPERIDFISRFNPDQTDDFANLLGWLRGATQPAANSGEIVWPNAAHDYEPEFANRDTEWPAIVSMLTGRNSKRIHIFDGPSNHGKSELLKTARDYAKQLAIPTALIDFKVVKTVSDLLGEFEVQLGDQLPGFRANPTNSNSLRADLKRAKAPLFIIFDTYEKIADNDDITSFVEHQLLRDIEESSCVVSIVAGQKIPDIANSYWKKIAEHFPLEPIRDTEPWQRWIERHYPEILPVLPISQLEMLITASAGVPGIMNMSCDNIARSRKGNS